MQCSKCKDYRPKPGSNYRHFICLACGQAWRLWMGRHTQEWQNDGVFERGNQMTERRSGFKYVTELSGNERFVSMIEFKSDIYVCTDRSMYKMVNECLIRMGIEISDRQPCVAKDFVF